MGDGTTSRRTSINLFGLGAIQVTKQVDGDTDELPASLTGSYTVSLACTRLDQRHRLRHRRPGGAERTLDGDGGTATYLGLPTGATCQVTETGSDPQSQETSVDPASVTVNATRTTPCRCR